MRKIKVKFDETLGSQQYSYLTDDYSIKVGDRCVVKSPIGVKIVFVTQVDVNDNNATKPIVCKIDLEAYEQSVAKLAKQNELNSKIEARIKHLTNHHFREVLAKKDSELADLLKQLETL